MTKEHVIQSLVIFHHFTEREAQEKVRVFIADTHHQSDRFSPSVPNLIAVFD